MTTLSSRTEPPSPFITKILVLLAQANGRDKVYKTCQYTARLVWWVLTYSDAGESAIRVAGALDDSLSEGRRVFRLPVFIEQLKMLMSDHYFNNHRTFLNTFKYFCTSGTFVRDSMDVVLWLMKIRVVNPAQKVRWEWYHNLLWLVAIAYNVVEQTVILRQVLIHRYRLTKIQQDIHNTITTPSKEREVERLEKINGDIADLDSKLSDTILNYTRYTCDAVLCLCALQRSRNTLLNGGFGLLSSIISLHQTWRKII